MTDIVRTPTGWTRDFPLEGREPAEVEALAEVYVKALRDANPFFAVSTVWDDKCVQVTVTTVESPPPAVDDLQRACLEAKDRIEQLEVQLAGCSVAAQGYATGDNDCVVGDYGWSVPFDDVKELRKKFDDIWETVVAVEGLAQDDIALHPNRLPCPEILERIEEMRERIGRAGKIWRKVR